MALEYEPGLDRAGVLTRQGDLATLDSTTSQEATQLRDKMGGGPTEPHASGPFIWGSIRILSVQGKWSWWRTKKR